MTTTHSCVMTFNTSLEAKRLVRIPNPRANLSASAATTASASFVAANPFDETVGSLINLARADLVTQNETVLF